MSCVKSYQLSTPVNLHSVPMSMLLSCVLLVLLWNQEMLAEELTWSYIPPDLGSISEADFCQGIQTDYTYNTYYPNYADSSPDADYIDYGQDFAHGFVCSCDVAFVLKCTCAGAELVLDNRFSLPTNVTEVSSICKNLLYILTFSSSGCLIAQS